MKKLSEKGRAVRFFLCTMLVLIFCSVIIWGFQSDWGKVKIKRINIDGPNGTQISSLVYIPQNATADTPAPVAVIYHGRSNHAHSNDTWSMELARRGYVVLSPDLQGGGESDVTVDRNIQSVYVAQYANNLDYVIKDKINLIGYSAGTQTVLKTYAAMEDKFLETYLVQIRPQLVEALSEESVLTPENAAQTIKKLNDIQQQIQNQRNELEKAHSALTERFHKIPIEEMKLFRQIQAKTFFDKMDGFLFSESMRADLFKNIIRFFEDEEKNKYVIENDHPLFNDTEMQHQYDNYMTQLQLFLMAGDVD